MTFGLCTQPQPSWSLHQGLLQLDGKSPWLSTPSSTERHFRSHQLNLCRKFFSSHYDSFAFVWPLWLHWAYRGSGSQESCWPFHGASGFITLRLIGGASIASVQITHTTESHPSLCQRDPSSHRPSPKSRLSSVQRVLPNPVGSFLLRSCTPYPWLIVCR